MKPELSVVGIDLAKSVFHLVGMDERGTIILRKRLARSEVMPFMAKLPRVLVGMEACSGTACRMRAIGRWHRMPHVYTPGGMMHGTHFAQFSTEVLHRGAAAVLPQHLPDRWLDALLEEADLLAPGEGDGQEGDRVEECCAGLLGAVLVVLMEHGGHPDTLEVAASTLMRHMHCYILALAAERVSRDTDIWVEPPTLANLFDEERAVRTQRRSPRPSPEGQGGR